MITCVGNNYDQHAETEKRKKQHRMHDIWVATWLYICFGFT